MDNILLLLCKLKKKRSLNDLLMGEDFLNAVTEFYMLNYSQIVFTDFLWTMRSIYLTFQINLQFSGTSVQAGYQFRSVIGHLGHLMTVTHRNVLTW